MGGREGGREEGGGREGGREGEREKVSEGRRKQVSQYNTIQYSAVQHSIVGEYFSETPPYQQKGGLEAPDEYVDKVTMSTASWHPIPSGYAVQR